MEVQRMIRKDGFKLLIYPKIDKVLLFDMEKDPNEMNNLADDLEYKDKIKSLFSDLLELQKTMDDELDLSGLYDKMFK
jgi:arylsulfatase A-like enzyme